jgi:hypothetical protein
MRPGTLRGSIEIAAFLFDEQLIGEGEARRRILALWTPGARLQLTRAGLVLALPRPHRVRVDAAPGLPLVARRGALVGLAAPDHWLAQLGPPAGSLVLARDGEATVVADGRPASPAAWLELGPIEILDAAALSGPAQLPMAPGPPPSTQEVLGPAVPRPAESREAIMRAARGQAGLEEEGGFGDWLGRVADRVGGWLGLHQLLGRKHGRYLAELMQMLEGGEVHEGLRHAIPLESVKELARRRQARLLWRTPRARESLTISPARTPARSSLTLGDELFARLRQIYRQTFERLDAQGRREEAAFVLAELLQQDEEAVAYLEQHGELRRAAELAEARGCAPGLVVRAWFLAGDRDRAVRLARERGAFPDAIARLGKRPGDARALRLLWADALASAGDYVGAIQAIQTLPEAAPLLARWLDQGLEIGEGQTARLLALMAALLPDRWPEMRARADEWMGAGAAAFHRRRALAEALLKVPPGGTVSLMARRCLRACLTEPYGPSLGAPTLQHLVHVTQDQHLLADLPLKAYGSRGDWRRAGAPLATTLEGSTTGFRDAVVLPSGRFLVAQGDLGVALLGPSGARLHQFDVPADRLVIADAGDRAIAIARRGEASQLSRLDLRARRAAPWGLIPLGRFCDSFDGNTWLIAEKSRVLALDALAEQPRCFWSVDFDDEVPQGLTRTAEGLDIIAGAWGLELWRYRLPALSLESRQPITLDAPGISLYHLVPPGGGAVFAVCLDLENKQFVAIAAGPRRRELRLPLLEIPEGSLYAEGAAAAGFWAFALPGPRGLELRLVDGELNILAELSLPGARRAVMRFCDRQLVVVRDDGPLLTLDLDSGALRTIAG